MPKVAPDGAAEGREPSTPDGAADRSHEREGDAEAERLAELAARSDPVPAEVTEAARRAWLTRRGGHPHD